MDDIDLETMRGKLNSMAQKLEDNDTLLKGKLTALETDLRIVAQSTADALDLTLRAHVQDTVVGINTRLDRDEQQQLRLQTAIAAVELRANDLETLTLDQHKRVQGEIQGDQSKIMATMVSLQQRVAHAERIASMPQTAAAPLASVFPAAAAQAQGPSTATAGNQTNTLAPRDLTGVLSGACASAPNVSAPSAAAQHAGALEAERVRQQAALNEEARLLAVEKAHFQREKLI